MLPKKQRLAPSSVLSKTGTMSRAAHVIVKRFPTQYIYSRFGIVLSRASAPGAVRRNAVRRIFFNEVRKVMQKIPVGDFLFILLPSAAKISLYETRQVFEKQLQQLIGRSNF